MMFAPSAPLVPVSAIVAATAPVETSGLTMYHATPALLCAGLLSKLTAVSSAPHTLPFANMTCCMRVSFESSLETTSSWAGAGGLNTSCQQPVPKSVCVVVSLMQWPCGVLVPGAVPDPGWSAFGGTAYWPTVETVFDRPSEGVPSSEDVFVSAHVTIWLEARGPGVPLTGRVASSAAFELRKYSVPPAASS